MAKSMNLNAAGGISSMMKEGNKTYDGIYGAVLRNIEAGKAISSMVQTSLGPNGMNKLVVNHLEKILVTSDCATIVRELEVQHPAAKMLVMASEMQESEYGDNTNFVISFAGELLKLAEDLIRNGLHTAEIVSGYNRAYQKVLEILPTLVHKSVTNPRDVKELTAAIKSVLSTKQYGYEDLLSELVVKAALTTVSPTSSKPSVNLDSVRVAKLPGGSVNQSTVIKGMVLLRDTEGIVKKVENAKVAVYGCGFETGATEAKGTVLIKNAEELLNYNKSEEKKIEEVISSIAATGVTCCIINGTISEMALHFLDRFKIMTIKITSKFELRRLCLAIGASACVRLGPATPEELGFASTIDVREISGRKVIVVNQTLDEDTSIATIVVRASTANVLNDIERTIDDGTHAVKAIFEDPRLLVGAGAIELELSKQLKAYANEVMGLDQYAIRKFAEAFDVVPRTLAENSGCDPTSIMHEMHLSHMADGTASYGFCIDTCKPFDAAAAGIFDIYATKLNALRLAVDAAVTVLRIDQIVMSKPAGGPKPKSGGGMDAD